MAKTKLGKSKLLQIIVNFLLALSLAFFVFWSFLYAASIQTTIVVYLSLLTLIFYGQVYLINKIFSHFLMKLFHSFPKENTLFVYIPSAITLLLINLPLFLFSKNATARDTILISGLALSHIVSSIFLTFYTYKNIKSEPLIGLIKSVVFYLTYLVILLILAYITFGISGLIMLIIGLSGGA